MKRVAIKAVFPLVLFLIAAASVAGAQDAAIRRFGLFIGANDGGRERVTLRWAISDAEKMRTVMTEVGGMLPGDSIVLRDPSVADVNAGLTSLAEKIARAKERVRRAEIVVYYSGHSDETGLMLGEEHLAYPELREGIHSLGADVSIAILDSCASGAFTRTKGGVRIQPFLLDESSDMSGHAFLTSSSEDEVAQESDRIAASYFTHFIVSGLRGAADNTGDGRITLQEAYDYAFRETLSLTTDTQAGPQHPAYDIQLAGTGELVLSDITQPTGAIVIPPGIAGRLYIWDESGSRLLAEINKPADRPVRLALAPDVYAVELRTLLGRFVARIDVGYEEERQISESDFLPAESIATRTRGGERIPALIDGDDPKTADDPNNGDGATEGPDVAATPTAGSRIRALIDGDDPSVDEFLEERRRDAAADPGRGGDEKPGADDERRVTGSGVIEIGGIRVVLPEIEVVQESDGLPWWPFRNREEEQIVEQVIEVEEPADLLYSPFYLEVIPGLGFPTDGSGRGIATNVAGGALFARVARLDGVMAAGIMTLASGRVNGFQAAGIGTISDDVVNGASAAGVFNVGSAQLNGAQMAGVFNTNDGSVLGAQFGGVFNISSGAVMGSQAAGVFNIAEGGGAGLQVAGVFNVGEQEMIGAQIAGGFNAADDVIGAQIAPVNIASGTVTGTQIGVVNIADDMYGVPIGVFSWVTQGIHEATWWFEEELNNWVGVSNGSRNFYNIVYAGMDKDAPIETLEGLAIGLGLGFRLDLEPFHLDLELSARRPAFGTTGGERAESLFSFENTHIFPNARAMAGIRLGPFGGFAGISLDTEIVRYTPTNRFLNPDTREHWDFEVGDLDFRLYPTMVFGFSFGQSGM